MAWLSRTERAVRDGDLHIVAQEIVADLKRALEEAATTDERIRLTKELGEWLPKTVPPGGRPVAEVRPLPAAEPVEERTGPAIAWDGE